MTRILIVAPNWIGDTLLAQPLFARLHATRPGIALDAVAPAWTAPVLARMPEIEEVIETPLVHGRLQLGARLRLASLLRQRRYDEAIVLPNSWKSALAAFLAGIPRRVGFIGEARYGLLNVRHHLDEAAVPLMAERYAQLAERPGEPPHRPLLAPRLEVDEANLAISIARLGLDRSRPIAAFCPGAEFGPAKRWPARHFATLARALAAHRRHVWLIGSPADRPIGDEIAKLANGDGDQSLRAHGSRRGDRPPLGRRSRGVQRFGPDARRGGARPAARRTLRLLEPGAHAAVGAGPAGEPRHRMQPLLSARVPARALQVHERLAAWAGARRDPGSRSGAGLRAGRSAGRTSPEVAICDLKFATSWFVIMRSQVRFLPAAPNQVVTRA